MNIEEKADALRRIYPAFGKKAIFDVDNKGHEFCEMVYPNDNNPALPITVTINDDGFLISVGQISNVTGNRPITFEQAVSAIDDVLKDKIIFVLGYRDGDDLGSGAPFLTDIYAITSDVDDMSEELEDFIARISKPVKGLKRKLTSLKGRFIITDFSGSYQKTILR